MDIDSVQRNKYKSTKLAMDTGSFSWRPKEKANNPWHRQRLYLDEIAIKAAEVYMPSLYDGTEVEKLVSTMSRKEAILKVESRQRVLEAKMHKVLTEVGPSLSASMLEEVASRAAYASSRVFYGSSLVLWLLRAARMIRDRMEVPEHPRASRRKPVIKLT